MNVYDGLVRYASGTLEVEPALASDWTISDDGTVYTFTLRDGVSFHDGSPFDAEAVVFNFERIADTRITPTTTPVPSRCRSFFSAVESVEATGEMEVTFTLNAPYAPFLSNLAYPTGLIVSPAAGDGPRVRLRPQPVGDRPLHLHRVAVQRGRGGRGPIPTTGTARPSLRRSSSAPSPTPTPAPPRCWPAGST